MATIVCQQGLQSCLDQSQFIESRSLRLRLSSPKSHFSHSLELALKPCLVSDTNTSKEAIDNTKPSNHEMGGWSFLQSLANPNPKHLVDSSFIEDKYTGNNIYVHPLVKKSSSKLSEKSLELCTESLGCETGSDINTNEESSLFLSLSKPTQAIKFMDFPTREQEQEQEQECRKKRHENNKTLEAKTTCRGRGGSSSDNFPPPLTSMRGTESLHVRPHREEGRLVISAVRAPQRRVHFQADRSDGRLRLCFVKDSSPHPPLTPTKVDSFDDLTNENDINEKPSDNNIKQVDNDYPIEENKNESDFDSCFNEENKEKEELGGIDEKTINNNIQGTKRRCKEGEMEKSGPYLINWREPLWVATS